MIKIKRAIKTTLTVILIIILLLALGLLIALGLAFQDENTDKYNSTPSYEPVKEMAISAAVSNEAFITQDDLNSVAAYLLELAKANGYSNGDCTINAVYFEINTDTPSRIYFQISCKGKKLGFSADVNIMLNESSGNIEISFDNAAVGKLNIPNSLVLKALSMTDLEQSASCLSINDLTVAVPSSYSIEIEDIGTLVDIDIEHMELSDGQIYIQTNPIALDIANNIKNIFGNEISSITDYFGDLF